MAQGWAVSLEHGCRFHASSAGGLKDPALLWLQHRSRQHLGSDSWPGNPTCLLGLARKEKNRKPKTTKNSRGHLGRQTLQKKNKKKVQKQFTKREIPMLSKYARVLILLHDRRGVHSTRSRTKSAG